MIIAAGLCKEQNEIEWTRLKKKIEDGLTPAEDRVAGKLKAQFSSTKSPTALATEFKKYSDLLKREGLRRTLRSERESLLSVFGDLIGNFFIFFYSNKLVQLRKEVCFF